MLTVFCALSQYILKGPGPYGHSLEYSISPFTDDVMLIQLEEEEVASTLWALIKDTWNPECRK